MSSSTRDTEVAHWQRLKLLLAQALELDEPGQRAFLDQLADPALRDEIASLLAAAHDADGGLETMPAALALEAVQARTGRAWIGRRLGPWRIVSLIASGGMGEVWRAERVDGEFEQQVAVKAMREGFNPVGLVARFRAERQILASLDHPNLAKVLDGGITDDDVPYFVMELVDGEPIDAYVERMQLDIEQRVRLFRSVCQVVHYAHQKHVVHRDLKADNILVTGDGVVKLVDFGIAKRFDPEVPEPPTQTVTAQRMMTLVYSSPEQVRGGEITPASDIYSLGVVLYKLLTKTSPYPAAATTGSAYELTRAICDTEPVPPSLAAAPELQVERRRLRGDLDAVVMMALRKDPARRYATAEAMSEDLFRHLEGLPVQARRGAWSYRAGRFVLRHRAVVAAAMLANLALVAGIGVASYEAWQANQQRERAERHFASLHRLAHVFIFDVHDAIQNLPGSTSARWLVVNTALDYLKSLGAEAAGDAALQTEIAAGYRKVGDILGRPYVANLGDPKAAMDNYEQARQRLAPLAQSTAASTDAGRAARSEYAMVLQREGSLLDSLGRYKEAETLLRSSLAAATPVANAGHTDAADGQMLASIWLKLAQVQYDANELPAYVQSSDTSARLVQPVLARAPDNQDALLLSAALHDLRGQYVAQRDDSVATGQAALEEFRQSAAQLDHAHEIPPERADILRKQAAAHSNVGTALNRVGDLKGSAEQFRQATALLARLAARDPQDMDSRGTQALVTSNLSDTLRQLGELDASVASAREALALFDQLATGARQDASTQSATAVARNTLAAALFARADKPAQDPTAAAADRHEACQRYVESIQILQKLKDTSGIVPGNVEPDAVRQAMHEHCPGS